MTTAVQLDSTVVSGALYDTTSQTLVLQVNEGIYAYHNVHNNTFRGLTKTQKPTQYFNKNIRGKFDYTRVS